MLRVAVRVSAAQCVRTPTATQSATVIHVMVGTQEAAARTYIARRDCDHSEVGRGLCRRALMALWTLR